jgi:ketopantoate reductase
VLLGAGVVGLLLALALAAAKALIPQGDVAVVETIDWTAEESELEPTPFAAEPAATTAAPVIAEDPDVEVPSTTPAPAAATEGDDKRV